MRFTTHALLVVLSLLAPAQGFFFNLFNNRRLEESIEANSREITELKETISHLNDLLSESQANSTTLDQDQAASLINASMAAALQDTEMDVQANADLIATKADQTDLEKAIMELNETISSLNDLLSESELNATSTATMFLQIQDQETLINASMAALQATELDVQANANMIATKVNQTVLEEAINELNEKISNLNDLLSESQLNSTMMIQDQVSLLNASMMAALLATEMDVQANADLIVATKANQTDLEEAIMELNETISSLSSVANQTQGAISEAIQEQASLINASMAAALQDTEMDVQANADLIATKADQTDLVKANTKIASLLRLLCASEEPSISVVESAGIVETSSLQLNSQGFPVIAYTVRQSVDDSTGDLKLAVCRDATCSATPRTQVLSAIANPFYQMSLKLNAQDFPVVAFGTTDQFEQLELVVCHDTTCSATPTTQVLDSSQNSAMSAPFISLQLNSQGFPVLSYYSEYSLEVKLVVCHDTSCSDNPTIQVLANNVEPNPEGAGATASLGLNAHDFPLVSYTDNTDGSIKLVVCHDKPCTDPPPTIQVLDTEGFLVLFSSMQVNWQGFPVVSYLHVSSDGGFLKLAVCKDTSCSASPTIRVLDSFGSSSSLQLNSQGFPVVSYYGLNSELKLAVCHDTSCSATPTMQVLDVATSYYITSLQLDSQDAAVVCYQDETNQNLKLATQISPYCLLDDV